MRLVSAARSIWPGGSIATARAGPAAASGPPIVRPPAGRAQGVGRRRRAVPLRRGPAPARPGSGAPARGGADRSRPARPDPAAFPTHPCGEANGSHQRCLGRGRPRHRIEQMAEAGARPPSRQPAVQPINFPRAARANRPGGIAWVEERLLNGAAWRAPPPTDSSPAPARSGSEDVQLNPAPHAEPETLQGRGGPRRRLRPPPRPASPRRKADCRRPIAQSARATGGHPQRGGGHRHPHHPTRRRHRRASFCPSLGNSARAIGTNRSTPRTDDATSGWVDETCFRWM